MNELVFIKDNEAVTDSLTVADVFGKEHRSVTRDITVQINKLKEAGELEWAAHNLVHTQYVSEQNKREYHKFNLTEDGFVLLAMSYTTPEAMKMKIKFMNEFKKMKKALTDPQPLSERDQLVAAMKLSIESNERIDGVEEEIGELKTRFDNELTLNHGQATSLNHAIKKRVEHLWNIGVHGSMETKRQMYSNIHSHLRRGFQAPTYREVKRVDFDDAIQWVSAWRPL